MGLYDVQDCPQICHCAASDCSVLERHAQTAFTAGAFSHGFCFNACCTEYADLVCDCMNETVDETKTTHRMPYSRTRHITFNSMVNLMKSGI